MEMRHEANLRFCNGTERSSLTSLSTFTPSSLSKRLLGLIVTGRGDATSQFLGENLFWLDRMRSPSLPNTKLAKRLRLDRSPQLGTKIETLPNSGIRPEQDA